MFVEGDLETKYVVHFFFIISLMKSYIIPECQALQASDNFGALVSRCFNFGLSSLTAMTILPRTFYNAVWCNDKMALAFALTEFTM